MEKTNQKLPVNGNSQANEPTITLTQSQFIAYLESVFAEGEKQVKKYLESEEWRAIYE